MNPCVFFKEEKEPAQTSQLNHSWFLIKQMWRAAFPLVLKLQTVVFEKSYFPVKGFSGVKQEQEFSEEENTFRTLH